MSERAPDALRAGTRDGAPPTNNRHCRDDGHRVSTLDAQDLLERVDYIHQIRLRSDDGINVLVGAGRLVEHARVLAALHTGRGLRVVRQGEDFLGLLRDMARPAPCEHEVNDSRLPLPRTMKLFAPMLPGMMPSSPSRAGTAPLRVTKTFAP